MVRWMMTVALVGLLLVGWQSVADASDVRLGARIAGGQPYVDVEVAAGGTEQFEVIVEVVGGPTDATIGVVDAHTGPAGGLRYHEGVPEDARVVPWVSVDDPGPFAVTPGTATRVAGRVMVPDDAEPGDHVAGLVVRQVDAAATVDVEGGALEVVSEVVLAVHVRVPGPTTHRLEIDGLTAEGMRGRLDLRLALANRGGRLIDAEGEITIVGGPVAVVVGTHHPTDEIVVPLRWTEADLPTGCYDATVELSYGVVGEGHDRTVTWEGCVDVTADMVDAALDDPLAPSEGAVWPWWWWVVLAVLLLVAAYAAGRRGRRPVEVRGRRSVRRRRRWWLVPVPRRRDDEDEGGAVVGPARPGQPWTARG